MNSNFIRGGNPLVYSRRSFVVSPFTPSNQVATISYIPDWDKKQVMRMEGQNEERAAMELGPEGKIVATFPSGTHTLPYANLLLTLATDPKKSKAAPAKKRPAGARKRKASSSDDQDSDAKPSEAAAPVHAPPLAAEPAVKGKLKQEIAVRV